MSRPEPTLSPPSTKPTSSVARIADDWYVACASEDLGTDPLATTILGIPMVIFRTESGEAGALLDRCPHRNVPLSLGRVRGPHLQCGYHGWEFDRQGACRTVPALCGPQASKGEKGRRVEAFPTRELDGYVWVYGTADAEPEREPFRLPHQDDPRYTTVRQELVMEGSVHAVVENALDVPHTAFLHAGLFRQDQDRNRIEVRVRRTHDRVEAEYIGEPRPEGLIGRVLAPGGGTVEHKDRFILPSIAQVEYSLGDSSHVLATTLLTPITDYETRLFGAVTLRLPISSRILGPAARALKPLALRILKQDATMLKAQTETIHRFGGERYVSTEIDVLGPHILRLLRQAARGAREPAGEPFEKTIHMMV